MSAATASEDVTAASSRRGSGTSGEEVDASTRAVARTMVQYELLISSQAERKRLESASRSSVKARGGTKPSPSIAALRRERTSRTQEPDDGAAVAGLFAKHPKQRAPPASLPDAVEETQTPTAATGSAELSWEHAVLAAVEDEAAQRAKAPPRCHLCAIVGGSRPSVPRREPPAPRPVSASVNRIRQLKGLVAVRGSARRMRPASAHDRGSSGPASSSDALGAQRDRPPTGGAPALFPRATTATFVRRNTGAMGTSVRSSSALGRGLSRTSGSKGSYRGHAPDAVDCLSTGSVSESDAADDAQAALLRNALVEKTAARATKRRRDLVSARPLTDAEKLRRSLDARRVHGRERDVALQRLSQSAQLARRSASATRFWTKAAEFH
jgi:hypothetical protein